MEIEARVKVNDSEIVKKQLEKLGAKFGTPETQKDSIFRQKGKEKKPQNPGDFILRIRQKNGKSSFTFKALTKTIGSWKEHQTNISNPEEMKQILTEIGFSKTLEMNKERQHARLGKTNLYLDNIKELGSYLEVEIVDDDVKKCKKAITNLLQKLGFQEKDIIHDGYVAILSKKNRCKV